jgi:mannosyl-3-phosphoglycerate phosphatase
MSAIPPPVFTAAHLVVTDLDGTLLDHHTYHFDPARPALDLLRRRGVPVIFCTSKTRAETEYWRQALDNNHPFIVENGGAIFVPSGYFPPPVAMPAPRGGYHVFEFGSPYAELAGVLRRASAESRCRVRGFAALSAEEVASLCGLDPDRARLAQQREYDEPFVILDEDRTGPLLRAIEAAGMRWTRGGRFYHLTGGNDKATAVRLLLGLYRTCNPDVRTIGLGDGPNDAPFLNIVDTAFLVRSPLLDRLQAAVPAGIPTTLPGPRGWNEAVLNVLAVAED